MTLTITVATPRCIYQSADFRLLDFTTGKTRDFDTQKIVLVSTFGWSASVCFAGIGLTVDVDVGEWLARLAASIEMDDPLDRLLDGLHRADEWLSEVPAERRHHSFSVGAFVGSSSWIVLVSNHESLQGARSSKPADRLARSSIRPGRPTSVISGQWQHVTRQDRRRIERIASKDPPPEKMYKELARLNADVAKQTDRVSPACLTTYLRSTGEGGGTPHGLGTRSYVGPFMGGPEMEAIETRIIEAQFGRRGARRVSSMIMRAENTESYHRIQLLEKPNDPSVHSNYGVYLLDRGDRAGAERAYRRALSLDPSHANALSNLANILWDAPAEASRLYRAALTSHSGHEAASFSYGNFLLRDPPDLDAARIVVDEGVSANPTSGRLYLLRAEIALRQRRADDALSDIARAGELHGDRGNVAALYAHALHLSGQPIGSVIAAYYAALAVKPSDAALKLNLAQLLFVVGDPAQALGHLRSALTLGLDNSAELEAQFYLLAHTDSDPIGVFARLRELAQRGSTMQWDVSHNIAKVSVSDIHRAHLLERLSSVLSGIGTLSELDALEHEWLR